MQPIKNLQTATGVKDAYTQKWIEALLARAKEMQDDESSNLSDAEIHDQLLRWVADNKDIIYSGFLGLKGKHFTRILSEARG